MTDADDIRSILETLAERGLFVVTAKEKGVLEALDEVPDQQLRFTRFNGGFLGNVAKAELERRGVT